MINQFSYRLRNSAGKYYKRVGSTLLLDVEPTELENTPDGWQDKAVNWKRSWERMGVIRSFTIPLAFVLDGAETIKALFIQQGYEADCVIEIHELNNSTRQYEPIFIGEVDFTTYDSDVHFTRCNFIEGGAYKLLTANEDTVYEIPIEDEDRVLVRMDGVNIYSKITFGGIDAANGETGPQLTPMGYINSEGENVVLAPAQQVFQEDLPADLNSSDSWLFRVLQNVIVRFRGTYYDAPRSDEGDRTMTGTLKLEIRTSTGRIITIVDKPVVNAYSQSEPFDVEIELLKGEKVFLVHTPIEGSDFLKAGVLGNSYFEFVNRAEQLDMACYRAETLFEKLCGKIGLKGESNLLFDLKSIPLQIVFTSLNGLVGSEGNVLKTSFKEFFKFITCVYPACSYIDEFDKLRIEYMRDAFEQTEILDVGEVSAPVVRSFTDLLFNKVDAGYQTQDAEEVNGKYIFNAAQLWTNKNKRVQETLDMVAPYITDPIFIEITRIKNTGKATTDDKSDNKVFAFHVDEEDVVITENGRTIGLYRPPVEVTENPPDPPEYHPPIYEGVLDDTIYNFELSPRHNLYRNRRYLASLMWKTDGILNLESSEKNKDIELHTLLTDWVEKEPIDLSGADPLFIPINISFEAFTEQNLFAIMKANPRGYIKFSFLGEAFYGFVQEINIQPKTDALDVWTLLCAPQTDLNKLNELISVCEAPAIVGEYPLLTVFDAKDTDIQVSGTLPITLTSGSGVPAGMFLELNGNELRLYGIPSEIGDYQISITVSNCSGSRTLTVPAKVVEDVQITGVVVEDVGLDYADISWNVNDYPTEITLNEPGGGIKVYTVPEGIGEYSFTGLLDDSDYSFQLRSIIGGSVSDQVSGGVFTTSYGCYNFRYFYRAGIAFYDPSGTLGSGKTSISYDDCDGERQLMIIDKPYGVEVTGEFCARRIIGNSTYVTKQGFCS